MESLSERPIRIRAESSGFADVSLSIPNNTDKIMDIITKTKLILNFNMELTQANYVKTFRANYISNIFN